MSVFSFLAAVVVCIIVMRVGFWIAEGSNDAGSAFFIGWFSALVGTAAVFIVFVVLQ